MLERHSISLNLKNYNSKIEMTLREFRGKERAIKADVTSEHPRKLKEYFTSYTCDSPSNTCLPNVTIPDDTNPKLM